MTGDATYTATFTLNTYTITATANPTNGGTVIGGGTYNHGESCTLAATAAEGYTFVNWTKGGTEVSTSASYTFTVTEAGTYVANFEINVTSYTVTVSANPIEGGSVSGGGSYAPGATATLTATVNEGYTFVDWTKDGQHVSDSLSFSFTVTEGGDYVANYSLINYAVFAIANPSEGGEVNGAGIYAHGATATLTATANEHYSFVNWTEDGSVVSTEATYSFTVTEAGNYVANFKIDSYAITATANPSEGGEVNGAGTYNHGATATLTATANEGYTFVNWTLGNAVVSTTATYSFTVTEAGDYVANFEVNEYEITASANPTIGGEVSGAGTYTYGATATLTATAAENFGFINWTKGNAVVSTEATYSFTVTEAADYVANFGMLPSVTQTSHFVKGWSWWSTYIEQNDATGLTQLETGLGTSGQIIKNQSASLTHLGNGWFGSLEALDNAESYRVKTSAAVDVTITGAPVATASHPVTLRPNWTWIGYPCVTEMSVTEALSGITPQQEDVLKTQYGMAVYLSGAWYGPLGTLEPGMGLMYLSHSSDDMTLTFPTMGKGDDLKPNLTPENNHWQPNMAAYPDNMTVMAVVELEETELQADHYELAAFANGECRGSVQMLYIEPLNRYMAILTVAGDAETELHFALYDKSTGEEYFNADETLTYASNAVVGISDELYTVHFSSSTGLDELDKLVEVFPNPVGKGQVFHIGMTTEEPCVMRVETVNALGAVLSVETSTEMFASFKAPRVPGVYTLRISVGGKGTCYRKLVVK